MVGFDRVDFVGFACGLDQHVFFDRFQQRNRPRTPKVPEAFLRPARISAPDVAALPKHYVARRLGVTAFAMWQFLLQRRDGTGFALIDRTVAHRVGKSQRWVRITLRRLREVDLIGDKYIDRAGARRVLVSGWLEGGNAFVPKNVTAKIEKLNEWGGTRFPKKLHNEKSKNQVGGKIIQLHRSTEENSTKRSGEDHLKQNKEDGKAGELSEIKAKTQTKRSASDHLRIAQEIIARSLNHEKNLPKGSAPDPLPKATEPVLRRTNPSTHARGRISRSGSLRRSDLTDPRVTRRVTRDLCAPLTHRAPTGGFSLSPKQQAAVNQLPAIPQPVFENLPSKPATQGMTLFQFAGEPERRQVSPSQDPAVIWRLAVDGMVPVIAGRTRSLFYPAAPKLQQNATAKENAAMLRDAYSSAAHVLLRRAGIKTARRPVLHVLKTHRMMASAAHAMLDSDVAPIAWVTWSFARWNKQRKEDGRPPEAPPARWVFNPVRIKSQHGFFKQEIPSQMSGRHVLFTPLLQRLRWDHGAMINHLRKYPDLTPELARRVAAAYFPDGFEEALNATMTEHKQIQETMTEEARGGAYVW